jgi:hypothetical protein
MGINLELCRFLFQVLNAKSECISNDYNYSYYKNGLNSSNSSSKEISSMYYIDLCYKIESNLNYLYWLFNLFSPLLKLILVLFLLPFIIVLFIYANALFLFLNKHWLSLKVRWSGMAKTFYCFFFYILS